MIMHGPNVMWKLAVLVCGVSLVVMATGCSRNEPPAPASAVTATPTATPRPGTAATPPEAGMSREERIAAHQAKIDKIVKENREKAQSAANRAAKQQDTSVTSASQAAPK
jgi:hypothetical protein